MYHRQQNSETSLISMKQQINKWNKIPNIYLLAHLCFFFPMNILSSCSSSVSASDWDMVYASRTYGMSLNYLNRYGGRAPALIANNCIRMYQGYGVRSTSNRLCFFHNTVRVSGEGAVCGYRHSGDSRGMTVLRGNVIDVLQAPALDFNGDGNSDDLGLYRTITTSATMGET